jgi:GNAT superfamily N-acetyltransferase
MTGVRVSSDPAELDVDWIHAALSQRAYWALGRSRDAVERSIRNSLCFAAFDGDRQVGFARVVTDQATFAWVCDVFVDETARGRGIGAQLIGAIVADPRLRGTRMALATRDAGDLYREHGDFQPLANPERWMERLRRP